MLESWAELARSCSSIGLGNDLEHMVSDCEGEQREWIWESMVRWIDERSMVEWCFAIPGLELILRSALAQMCFLLPPKR